MKFKIIKSKTKFKCSQSLLYWPPPSPTWPWPRKNSASSIKPLKVPVFFKMKTDKTRNQRISSAFKELRSQATSATSRALLIKARPPSKRWLSCGMRLSLTANPWIITGPSSPTSSPRRPTDLSVRLQMR